MKKKNNTRTKKESKSKGGKSAKEKKTEAAKEKKSHYTWRKCSNAGDEALEKTIEKIVEQLQCMPT